MDKTKLYYEDTIAAISTPLGEGGISVIRISGKDSHRIAKKIFVKPGKTPYEYRKLYYGKIIDAKSNNSLDNVLCTLMKAPNSYTGENVVEIHSHGGYIVPKKILELVITMSARTALPGEFTNRAFLNGKMDLAQAEAVADIITAQTEKSLRQAENQLQGNLSRKINELKDKTLDILAQIEAQVDFPEEDIDPVIKKTMLKSSNKIKNELTNLMLTYEKGRIFKEGVYTAIVGKPNVGKSSILNALIGKERAIVSPTPGTTRDFIEEIIDIEGIPLKIVDTAGIRDTEDEIEKAGVEIALKKSKEAEFLLIVLDKSRELDQDDIKIINESVNCRKLFIINKIDIKTEINNENLLSLISDETKIEISAKTGKGIDQLKSLIFNKLMNGTVVEGSDLILTNVRHKNAIIKALDYLNSFIDLVDKNESPEFLSIDLRSCLNSLGEITGEITTEDLLGRIFNKFCIGK
ncbi:MAG: tRNA uridine-5-carboxymethylaminomethyl(34) synthesis GTPase MnmE [Thermodesulfobacteriota bacterium]